VSDAPRWHDGIGPLSLAGVEEVRYHPASFAELRLVATIDRIRAEGRKYEKVLVELTAACEFNVEMARPSKRFRDVLDAAWQLVDPDHAIRDAEQLRAGCTQCGGKLERLDDGTVPELCEGCCDEEDVLA